MKTLLIVTSMVLAAQLAHADADKKMEEKTEAAAVKADVEITLKGDDTMKFDQETFVVKEGQTVALTFANTGNLPKIAMGHNVVILKPGVEPMGFSAASMVNKDTSGLPDDEEMLKSVVASTKVLGPGESETVTFTAPAPGAYPYVCTFPGHAALMKGVMTVTPK